MIWDYWPLKRLAIRHSLFAFRQKRSGEISGEQRSAKSDQRTLVIPERSLTWLIVEKLPLLLIAAASAAITLKAQHAARSWFPRQYRIGNAILAYGLYIRKAFWPSHLAVFYPHPGALLNWRAVVVTAALLLVVTGFVVFMGRRHRYLPVGWFWFLGTLVPMLGIVQVGLQAMADRYAYISFIGLFLMICWGVADFAASRDLPAAFLPATSVVVLLVLALVARQQIAYWQSDEALWAHTLQVTTGNWMAETQLATALAIEGRAEEALPHFHAALALRPDDVNSHMALGIYAMRRKDYRDAIAHFQVVANDKSAEPRFLLQVYKGLATAYQALGDTATAQNYRGLSRMCRASSRSRHGLPINTGGHLKTDELSSRLDNAGMLRLIPEGVWHRGLGRNR